MVDNGSHAPHHAAVAPGREILGLATLERGILVGAQRRHLIKEKIGDGLLATAIEVIVELHELLQFLAMLHLTYLYKTHVL